MNKYEEDICIIGAGITGLVVADSLRSKGYKNITIFEKEENPGGKIKTIMYNSKTYELGANFAFPTQKHIRNLIEKLNIKIDGPEMSRVNFDGNGQVVTQIKKSNIGFFIEELERLPNVLKKYKSLSRFDVDYIDEELYVTFSKWCEINNFVYLEKVYENHFVSYGMGYIEDVPAYYVLKIFNYNNFMSYMKLPEFFTWKDGAKILVESLVKTNLDIRLTQNIQSIDQNSKDKLIVKSNCESHEFDKVIVTSPLNKIKFLIKGEEDIFKNKMFSKIKYYRYSVLAFLVDNLDEKCGCIIDNISKERDGHALIWNSRWEVNKEENMIMVYSYNSSKLTKESHVKILKKDLHKLGMRNIRLYQYQAWNQCPHVRPEELKGGFYSDIERIQSENNIYYAGEIMSTSSLENCIGKSEYFVSKYF